jgi:serine protease Do
LTPELAAGLGLSSDRGVIFADVLPGTPGARAGLLTGDVVLTLDGKPMENGRQLQVNLYRRAVGDIVSLEVVRDGHTLKVPVTIAERYNSLMGVPSLDPRENLVSRLSILAVDLDKRMSDLIPVLRVAAGVVVASTVAGAIDAREGGLAAGDVIYAVNKKRVMDVKELRETLDAMKPGDPVVLHLERRGELMYLAFTIE